MEEFRIEVAEGQAKGVRIMRLVGPFTLKNVFEFQTIVRADSSPVTIVDLTDAPYMDSAALGSLLGLHVSCQKDGRRYGHILDPRDGCPVHNDCRSVTVIAPTCTVAGILSTTAFVLGPKEGLVLISSHFGAEGAITTESSRFHTARFHEYVAS